ncbi:MAG: hypothetical protein NTX38_15080 [Methylobacter sp.]|nr:hypothetical protein [Methylobacter sp.]
METVTEETYQADCSGLALVHNNKVKKPYKDLIIPVGLCNYMACVTEATDDFAWLNLGLCGLAVGPLIEELHALTSAYIQVKNSPLARGPWMKIATTHRRRSTDKKDT